MNAAHIINNRVVNIIVIDENLYNEMKDNYKDGILVKVNDGEYVTSGCHYINNKFYPDLPTNEMQSEARREYYSKYSDPLFFMWQRGEISEKAYLQSLEIGKKQYPYFYDLNGKLDIRFYEAYLEEITNLPQKLEQERLAANNTPQT